MMMSVAVALAMIIPAMAVPRIAAAKTVVLAMVATVDQVSPEDAKMYRVGGHDLDRVAYDDSKINPVTHTVPLTEVDHFIGGHWFPIHETQASSLNLITYKFDFAASVTHGRPIVALFESGDNGRMAMLARPDFHVLIAGSYVIDPRPLTAAEIAGPPPGANGPDIMPMMSGMKAKH